MRINKHFLFNEKEEAERILEEGFDTELIDYGRMYVIAKYFREKYNYEEKELRKKLVEFCKEHDRNFNPVLQSKYLDKWVDSAMKYNLRRIDSVFISNKDVAFLKTIKNERDRRLLFAAVVLAKALKISGTRRNKEKYKTSNNYYIKYNNFKDIIRISAVKNMSETKVAKMFHNYLDYISVYPPEKELIRLDFIDSESGNDIKVDNLDDISGIYKELFGHIGDKTFCERCGVGITKQSNRQKYCKSCAKAVKSEQTIALVQKQRQKQKERRESR